MRGVWGTRLLLAAALGWGGAARAQTTLFAADTPIALTIRGPVSAIAGGARGAQAATLSVNGTAESHPVTLTPRGITRLRRETCQFPPLRVEFASRPAGGALFAGQRRLKLVTHCRAAEAFQQYVLLEYAAYRLYNDLTPLSFRVRLATIDYVGADNEPYLRRSGFFIEDVDDVAARNRTTRARTGDRITASLLAPPDAARFAVFSYAIANLDWSMSVGPPGEGCCHNARLLAGRTGYVPMPYDFDFAGLVDAPYAVPPNSIRVANVRVRRYRGQCALNVAVAQAAAEMAGRRGPLLATLAATPGLNARSRDKASAFLSASLDRLADPAAVTKTCL